MINEKELLEKLKKELAEEQSKSSKKSVGQGLTLNKDMVILAILIVLVGFTAFQTVQLSGGASAATSNAPASSAAPSSLPSNLQDLPTQVGGC